MFPLSWVNIQRNSIVLALFCFITPLLEYLLREVGLKGALSHGKWAELYSWGRHVQHRGVIQVPYIS
jgi:hypothetical protein